MSPPSPELRPYAYPHECSADTPSDVKAGCVDTLITVKTLPPWLLSQGSASGQPTSGWLGTAPASPALVDRRSVRRIERRTLDQLQQQSAYELRHERCTLRRVARVLAEPLSTVGRVLKHIGLGRLKNLQPAEPVRRYQWARPVDMIHVDTKQLAHFERIGHRITGSAEIDGLGAPVVPCT